MTKVETILALGMNFNVDIPKPLLKVWLTILEPYSAEEVSAGAYKIMGSYTFKCMPPVGVMKQVLDEERAQRRVKAMQKALEESEALKLAKRQHELETPEGQERERKREFEREASSLIACGLLGVNDLQRFVVCRIDGRRWPQ